MHTPEGILSWPVLAGGAACAAAGVAIGLRKIDEEQLPRVAVLSSAFFVASLIHVPVPPTSAHLLLVGLMGVILGWAAFPAVLVALLLQAVLFTFGGISTLGVNTTVMALPAVVCYGLLNGRIRSTRSNGLAFAMGFVAGAGAILMAVALLACALLLSGREFLRAAEAAAVCHIPVMVIEGFVTGAVVVSLRQVRPQLLEIATPALAVARVDHAQA